MYYKGYEVIGKDDRILVKNVKDFHPKHTFECGQCFRWIPKDDGSYTGIVGRKAVELRYDGELLEISNTNEEDFINIWYDYFDLGRDYNELKKALRKDEIMDSAICFGYGIRLLRQDLWEMVISFILSANNRIPMIMKSIAEMSRLYGEPIEKGGCVYYSFPGIESLADAAMEQLETCRCGFRCKYIADTSRMVRRGLVNLEELHKMDTNAARKELMKLPGVGPKVADCILLYSGIKYDVFPIDVWVKRVMEVLYFKREASFREIQQFASGYFGPLAGFAQQYLFYYARENKIR